MIVMLEEARVRLSSIKKKVLVSGCFDVLHIGHIAFLKDASNYGNTLIIALEGDDFIRQVKKREPFHTQLERAQILEELRYVDVVVLLPEKYDTYPKMFEAINPTTVVVGTDEPYFSQKKAQIEAVGGKIISSKIRITHKSSTNAIRYLKE
ncbi:hypothetical protein A3D80_04005 [Candidatus Roizmanbacteria bacterium RIFCSPHIGHO2_02_FULL_40_13b]|uniref:Cytidyltransferase-like domain-containing protein n=1 Tax=Candidatus Roizmanbacteria bacterium RIFCSPHIGHO2_01_FULL_39_24 TaxID=1802032 RepID=A0A1F7GJZ1_9BACT|nr:MAG: hypothetical protein A2799_03580 [Candidatus Roizmanbacteria bacterium RIFCSPHIGHO2_01_FULL_39_24]OGK27956.1 MAG: hypothetical protein A3D80_04005 [Candidatus Roizmanbacteria bacterium RIFCSPHIGHO2_02_FULL_40_13b]OGK49423.1 MAG: hypothetical protein A3A56_03175 [Candidatus Roizmanbacteria bacterium RIFCSPLOWO2_01_FULL_40_32]OGK56361.1 MAG: hypothetical protein A3H83_02530 [Candidatus Roizmanbacteria bacterium RIFCSPLOWO2_02_FULL_39_8]